MNIKDNLLNPAERGIKYNYKRPVFFFLFKNILSLRMNGLLLLTSSITGTYRGLSKSTFPKFGNIL